MERLILNYINDPRSAKANFELAAEYERIQHYAGAASHFLRCAEWGDLQKDEEYIYESLLHLSILLGKLKDRTSTEEGWLFHAINFCPKRQEAYWLMSQFYERQGRWHETYTMANLGIKAKKSKLHIDLEFDSYMLIFQKAASAWWIGRTQEARELFFSLPDYPMNERYKDLVQTNLSSIGGQGDPFVHFDKTKLPSLRFKFEGYKTLEKTYGQVYQDLFVLCMLNGKRKGYYLEIGSADPYLGSNTALLEKQFGWRGISIEYNEELVKRFRSERANPVLCKDATIINYDRLLKQESAPEVIDYLQLDCEPPKTTYEILTAIPFERYKFAVITFEHDYYTDVRRKYRDLSRKFLRDQGYVLVVGNIGREARCPFEDWWVHPDLVSKEIIEQMRLDDNEVVLPEEYFFTCVPPPEDRKKSPLEGIPVVNWITLSDSEERHQYMNDQFKRFDLNSCKCIAYDGRAVDYMNHPKVIIEHLDNTDEVLNSGGIATSMSHLRAIKMWYTNTNDPYGLFVEDDISFETSLHWSFSWEDMIDQLPKGWKAVQLSLIKNRSLTDDDMIFQMRKWDNWSAFAYIISREYAKELIDKYIMGIDKYNLVLEDHLIPFPENVIFGPEREHLYTLPLLVENNDFTSTFFPYFIDTKNKADQASSAEFILRWWRENKNNNHLTFLFT